MSGLCSQFGLDGVAYSWFVLLGLGILVAACRRNLRQILVSLALLLFSLYLFWSIVESRPPRASPPRCYGNVTNICLALQSYHDVHGRFPPAYLANEDGEPMHSWRVLILPHLGECDLYKQYRFDEPWHGPNNRKLAQKMPSVYRCPDRKRKPDDFTTDYLAVTGPNTMWPVDQTVRISDVTDGTSNTVIVVESANCGIRWLEPLDLDVDTIPMKVNPKSKRGISSVHSGGALVGLVDGSVQYLSDSLPSNTVRTLLIRNDGETINWSDF